MELSNQDTIVKQEMEEIYQDRKFFGHPRGLAVLGTGNLCNSIAWAAFYAVFIYYLYAPFAKGLGFTEGQATSIMAAMGVCNSLFGIVGSWLADRVLGMRSALILGNATKALGFGLLAIPVANIEQGRILMFAALMFLCMPLMGSSNASLTAQLYHRNDDSRRDAAFTFHNIFNSLGGLLAPVVVGNLSMSNYHLGFGVAAFFAALYGACILVFSKKFFKSLGRRPANPITKEEMKKLVLVAGTVVIVLAVAISYGLLTNSITFNKLLSLITTMAFIIPLMFFAKLFSNKQFTKGEKEKFKPMRKLLLAQIVQCIVWAVTGPAILMYTDLKLDRTFMGIEFAPATFVSIGAAFALIFNPIATYLWTSTAFGKKIRSLTKMSLGFGLGSVTFFIIPLSLLLSNGKVNPLWYIACLLIDNFTGAVGGPSGISLMAKLAPKSYDTQIQTAWGQCGTIGNGIGILIFMVLNTVDKQLNFFPVIGVMLLLVAIYLRVTQNKLEKYINAE
jgi:POT family proton-dependent oligopeptide transporter